MKRCQPLVNGEVLVVEPELTVNIGRLKSALEDIRKKLHGPDVVNGSRFVRGSEYTSSLSRRIFSKNYNRLINLFFRTKLSDYQCEFKLYKPEVFKHLCFAANSNHRFWLTESLIKAYKMDYVIKEIPVYYDKKWRVYFKNLGIRLKNIFNLKKEMRG